MTADSVSEVERRERVARQGSATEAQSSEQSSTVGGRDVPEALTTYFDAINHEDWDRLATVWRPDAELIAVGARPRNGIADIVGYYPRTLAPWQQHLDAPTRFVVAGDTVTVEIHFTGRSADGVDVEFDAVDVFDLVDGKISRVTNWYDTAKVRALLPAPVPPVIKAYFDAINAEDWQSFRGLWAEGAEVLAAGARPRHGVEEVLGLYTKLFDHLPKHLDIPGRTVVSGRTSTVEVHFVGTTDTGRDIEFDAVDVIDVADGKISRLTNWYDTSKVRALIAGSG